MKMTKQPTEYAENAQKRSMRLGAPWTTTGSSQMEPSDSVHLPPLSPVLISPHALAHVSNASVLTSVAPSKKRTGGEPLEDEQGQTARLLRGDADGDSERRDAREEGDERDRLQFGQSSLMNSAPMENAAGALWLQMAVVSAMMLARSCCTPRLTPASTA